ncbi:hypothetical protein [Alysiella crassa]|nr:hypothetical protein [Alysiella crassa]UOP07751.1 hypothetical protein LVJ80_05220 [Alysiella crassa]
MNHLNISVNLVRMAHPTYLALIKLSCTERQPEKSVSGCLNFLKFYHHEK